LPRCTVLRDGNGSFKAGLERGDGVGDGGQSSLAEMSDLGDGDSLFLVAHPTGLHRHAFGRCRRSQSKPGVQRYDILSLVGPKAVTRGAAVPLSIARPVTISHCHAVLVTRLEAAAPAASSGLHHISMRLRRTRPLSPSPGVWFVVEHVVGGNTGRMRQKAGTSCDWTRPKIRLAQGVSEISKVL